MLYIVITVIFIQIFTPFQSVLLYANKYFEKLFGHNFCNIKVVVYKRFEKNEIFNENFNMLIMV